MKTWKLLLGISAAWLLALTGFWIFLIYCQSLDPRFFDRFDEYEVIDSKYDPVTEHYVELGGLWNFSSTAYEVSVYPDRNADRKSSELNKQIFWIVTHSVPPDRIEFDGKCYFVRSAFRPDWTYVNGRWVDVKTGKELCFYLLSTDGKRYTDVK